MYPIGLRYYSTTAAVPGAENVDISLGKTLVNLVEKEMLTLPEDSSIADAVSIMKDNGTSSIFVRSVSSSADSPYITGIVTERDILYRVIAMNKGPYKTILRDVMSSPVVTIDERASAAEAISIMKSNKFRRLLVIRKAKTKNVQLGLITLMSIIGNISLEGLDHHPETDSISSGKSP